MARPKTELIQVDPQEPEPSAIRYAAKVVETGGLVVVPTDTVYGLVCDPGNASAVEEVYRVKARRRDMPLALLLEDMAQAAEYVEEIPEAAVRAMQEFWPGALTVVLPDRSQATAAVRANHDSVGLRLPAHMVPRLVAGILESALASTSANRSEQAASTTADQALDHLEGMVHLVLDGGHATLGQESTVLSFVGHQPRLLREGVITLQRLREVLGTVED